MKIWVLLCLFSTCLLTSSEVTLAADIQQPISYYVTFVEGTLEPPHLSESLLCAALSVEQLNDCPDNTILITNNLKLLPFLTNRFTAVVVPDIKELPSNLNRPTFISADFAEILIFAKMYKSYRSTCILKCLLLIRQTCINLHLLGTSFPLLH